MKKRILENTAAVLILVSVMGTCGVIEFGTGLPQVLIMGAVGGGLAWLSTRYSSY